MLDGRQGGGTGEGGRARSGGDFGRTGPLPARAAAGGKSFDKELDDEIPF